MTAQAGDELTKLITTLVRDVPDYPQPGVMFKDITPLLADGAAFAAVIDALAGVYGPVDKVAGIEARGFVLAAPVACRLGAGFVPIRKQGKLPGATYAQEYDLEYGTATVEAGMIDRRLGALERDDLEAVERGLRSALGL